MLRDGGEVGLHEFFQIADAVVLFRERAYEQQSRRVSQRLEDSGAEVDPSLLFTII